MPGEHKACNIPAKGMISTPLLACSYPSLLCWLKCLWRCAVIKEWILPKLGLAKLWGGGGKIKVTFNLNQLPDALDTNISILTKKGIGTWAGGRTGQEDSPGEHVQAMVPWCTSRTTYSAAVRNSTVTSLLMCLLIRKKKVILGYTSIQKTLGHYR